MHQKTIIVSVALFLVIVIGMFMFAYLKKAEVVNAPTVVDDQVQKEGEVQYASITRITAKHYFNNGVHTLAGEIPMPTPCDLLEVDATTMESFPEQIAVDFNVINNAEFCSQVITQQRFKVSASASKEATFTAQFMGRHVELNLVPAADGESPDDFELFIKG